MRNAFRDLLNFQEQNPGLTDKDALIDQFFAQSDLIDHSTWSREDIRSHAEQIDVELTDQEVEQVADLLAYKTDANVGISWDTIASWIHYVKEDK